MSIFGAKNFVKKIIFPENTHEQVYVVNLDNLSKELSFVKGLKPLGKWYITNGKHWICHSELSFEDFQGNFLNILGFSKEDAQSIEFTIDYLPFCEILGL
ncbi:DUF3884 family protein [Streptococcus troglodytae]|uniref:Uncharacterized protein n=1 Tax=Streptococcus troglodytae TaxID=1111760 RepID=A0A1L7LM47_9STRE|nr:DUF3884 family protein [Streptococcus troglodytae]BAQ25295.1 uncharacterized protein SRT_20340 [Streptococcus troglodytae]